MKRLTKGEQTKKEILERANAFFNRHGVDHTIVHISKAIGMSKSRITNYFPKKDYLVLTLMGNYETKMAAILTKHGYDSGLPDFGKFIPMMTDIMKLMFQYRAVISYALVNPAMNGEIYQQIKKSYANNKNRIHRRLEDFAYYNLVKKDVLEPETFEEYFFQYMCMSSNWIISYNLLDDGKDIDTLIPRYLRAILCCLKPHLTAKGNENLKSALLELEGLPTPKQ